MIRTILRSITMLGGMLIFSISIAGVTLAAGPPGDHLNITEVFVDSDAGTILILGEDFDFGGALQVTLGEIGDITSDCTEDLVSDPQTITCDLSSNGFPVPGDYLLTVSTGNGQSQNDEYDLTIAAMAEDGNGPAECPGGFTELNENYCIQSLQDTSGEVSWDTANATCIAANNRLCTAGEWVYACQTLFLTDLPSGLEWLDDLDGGPNANRLGQAVSSASCTAGSSGSITLVDSHFRCCFSR